MIYLLWFSIAMSNSVKWFTSIHHYIIPHQWTVMSSCHHLAYRCGGEIISSFPYFAGYIKPQAPYFLWLVLVNSPAFGGWLRCLPFDPPVGLPARLTRSLHRRLIAAGMSQRWAPWIACLQICRYVTTVWCKEKRENMIKYIISI